MAKFQIYPTIFNALKIEVEFTDLVRNYTRLQELIASRRKQTLNEWNKLIKSTLDEVDVEIREKTNLPKDREMLFTFEGYQEWVRALGELKGWNVEGGWQNVETSSPRPKRLAETTSK